jgi:hypothetical protein
MVTTLLAGLRLWSGRVEECVELARSARRTFRDIGNTWGESQTFLPLSRGLVAAGRLGEARQVVIESQQLADGLPDAGVRHTLRLLPGTVAVHTGDPEVALEALSRVGEAEVFALVGQLEYIATLALALAQQGKADEALDQLARVGDDSVAQGPKAALQAISALANAEAGHTDEARSCAEAVHSSSAATTLDRLIAGAALGCAAAREGREAEAELVFSGATQQVDATDDRFGQVLIRLARGRALEALGAPEAASVLDDVRRRLDSMGGAASGWDRAFRTAVGATPAVVG